MAGTSGKGTIIEVSTDGTTYQPLCIMSDEARVEYGSMSVNTEFCMDGTPFVSQGNKEYGEQSYTHLWEEGNGSAGNKIVKDAAEATTDAAKTIHVRVTANNSGGANGTRYDATYMVTDYGHTFKKNELNKTEWKTKQLTAPVETAAA